MRVREVIICMSAQEFIDGWRNHECGEDHASFRNPRDANDWRCVKVECLKCGKAWKVASKVFQKHMQSLPPGTDVFNSKFLPFPVH